MRWRTETLRKRGFSVRSETRIGRNGNEKQKEARFGAKKSLHVIGETDFINPKEFGLSWAECFGGEEYGERNRDAQKRTHCPDRRTEIGKKIIETLIG